MHLLLNYNNAITQVMSYPNGSVFTCSCSYNTGMISKHTHSTFFMFQT